MKARDKKGRCFKYICEVFPGLGIEKLKTGVFSGYDIRNLIQEENFVSNMSALESNALNAFVAVVKNFSVDYKELVEYKLTCYPDPGANMSVKVYSIHSHLDRFLKTMVI